MTGEASWRTRNLGALLFAARDRCIGDKLGFLASHGWGGITDAQLVVFHHLDAGGSRLTDLADRAGLAKSSMAEFVSRAMRQGLVAQHADPGDRRAKRVIHTNRGRALAAHLQTAIDATDASFAAVAGDHAAAEARTILSRLTGSQDDVGGMGRLFAGAARSFAADVRAKVDLDGDPVGEPLLTLFRLLDLDGSRLTDLARRARISKPSMRGTVGGALERGLIEQRPDPVDRRAYRLSFTTAGLTLLDRFKDAVAATEGTRQDRVGSDALARLRATLTAYTG